MRVGAVVWRWSGAWLGMSGMLEPWSGLLRHAALGALLAVALAVPAGVAAEDLGLELNAREAVEGSCRLTFVTRNETGTALEELSVELALFDPSGALADRLILEFGAVPADRPRVVQFLLERACDGVGRLMLNDVDRCRASGEGADLPACAERLAPASRIDELAFGP